MRETHHRIKNSLQVIAALINVQRMENAEVVPVSALDRLSQHVSGLAAIHDILTQTSNDAPLSQTASAATVLAKLVAILKPMIGERGIVMNVEDIILPVRHISGLSILVNELVSNAIKHGGGSISISLTCPHDLARLEVCDEGPGFPERMQGERDSGTGLELIRTIARWDMAGQATFNNLPQGGAQVVVEFPMPTQESADSEQ
jgi:two-component sensor histidine kinase